MLKIKADPNAPVQIAGLVIRMRRLLRNIEMHRYRQAAKFCSQILEFLIYFSCSFNWGLQYLKIPVWLCTLVFNGLQEFRRHPVYNCCHLSATGSGGLLRSWQGSCKFFPPSQLSQSTSCDIKTARFPWSQVRAQLSSGTAVVS